MKICAENKENLEVKTYFNPFRISASAKTSEIIIRNIDQKPENPGGYENEIYNNIKTIENLYTPTASYLKSQVHINDKMRSILLDWIIEIHYKFKLRPETLYLTVNLIDRFLEKEICYKENLQLVGVTCL